MSLAASDLGDVATLATALGLVDAAGSFREDWLTRPGHYLSSVLSDTTQRDAIIAFVDEALGGAERETNDEVVWLPIVAHHDPRVSFFVVLDPRPTTYVAVGIGVRLVTGSPETPTSTTSVHVPLFRAGKSGESVADPILIGTAGAVVRVESEITIGDGPPLGGIGVGVTVPTDGAEAPLLSLTLKRLQLPGTTVPRDLEVSLDRLDELDDVALDLVLGLIRAQADALGAGSPLPHSLV